MLFGLVGKKLGHSYSTILFKERFAGIHQYKLYELEDLSDFRFLTRNEKQLKGLNVTIPYKEDIKNFLDELDIIAAEIGAVNTILIENNKMKGFNTDYLGFEKAYIHELIKKHKLALILGTGGSAKAVAYVLKKYNISYLFISRNKKYMQTILYTDICNFIDNCTLLINTTPLGMFPNIGQKPDIKDNIFKNKPVVIDIIYNPEKTLLLENAEKYDCKIYNGLPMLKQQAYESWKIWGIL